MDRPQIVLGLGNPGARYRETRHNLGFRVVERLAARAGRRLGGDAALAETVWTTEFPGRNGPWILAQPRTYMNRSGLAAAALCRHYEVAPGALLVVYDDADLELGRLRIRPEGSAGGHNGMASLIEALRTEAIPRVRLGVRGEARGGGDLADYVLAPFAADERPVADALVELAADAVLALRDEGLTPAMNRYNARSARPSRPAEANEEE